MNFEPEPVAANLLAANSFLAAHFVTDLQIHASSRTGCFGTDLDNGDRQTTRHLVERGGDRCLCLESEKCSFCWSSADSPGRCSSRPPIAAGRSCSRAASKWPTTAGRPS